MHQDLDKCLLMHCLQIAIFTLDTVKITKRFACANKQRAQQTGALPTELTRQWQPWTAVLSMKDPLMSPPPPQPFHRLRRLCCFDTLRKIPFLWGPVTKIYGEQKSLADFLFTSFVNRKIHQAKKRQQIGFRVRAKHYVSLENYFSKKLSDMTRVSVSVSNFVNMRGVNPLDFSVSFKHTVLPFFASFGRSLRELLPQE